MVFIIRPTLNLCNLFEESNLFGARIANSIEQLGAEQNFCGGGFFLLWFVLKISSTFLICLHTKTKARQ